MIRNIFTAFRSKHLNVCQEIGAFLKAPSQTHIRLMLFGIGVGLMTLGLAESTYAQAQRTLTVDPSAFRQATCAVFAYLEGSFGALVMVSSGIGAILSAAFGQYRAALGLMVVAIGSFVVRSLTTTFFGDANTNQGGCDPGN